jgi:hypothetical protein
LPPLFNRFVSLANLGVYGQLFLGGVEWTCKLWLRSSAAFPSKVWQG